MRRLLVGLAVLVAVLVGAGAYAFGGVTGGTERGGGAIPRPAPVTTVSTAASGDSATPGPTGSSPSTSAVPPPGPSASSTTTTRAGGTGGGAAGGCAQGEKQREVETALAAIGGYGAVVVDGVQSAADCAAIVKFQQRFGISPSNGRAGPTTGDVARRIAASHTVDVRARCRPAASGLTACVDLTLQTVWVVRDGGVIWGPTVVRTGFRGYATPAGTFKIFRRNTKEWSVPYKVWLPYWQNFVRGIGFHQTTTYLHSGSIGSHGCVNLLPSDARALWSLLGVGTTVHTFGRRTGT